MQAGCWRRSTRADLRLVLPSCASTARITFQAGAHPWRVRPPDDCDLDHSLCTICGFPRLLLRGGPTFRRDGQPRAERRASSIRSISAIDVERKSTRMLADSGIEFTEVPPRITPTLKVVLGEAGTGVWLKDSTARERARIGLGVPKVGPRVSARTRTILQRAAAQSLGHDRVGSSAIDHHAVGNRVRASAAWRKRVACRAGRLQPSSPTLPINTNGSAAKFARSRAHGNASIAAMPAPLSEDTGP